MLLTQTLRSIPYLFNNSQTAAFSVLSNLWNVTYIPQTHHSCYPPDDVFIQAFSCCSESETKLKGVTFQKLLICIDTLTVDKQALHFWYKRSNTSWFATFVWFPPPFSCYWLFQCVVSGRKISYCNLKRPLDNLLTSSVAVYLCMKMKQ